MALGGNALKQAHEKGTIEEQKKNIEKISRQLTVLIERGNRIVITHGNGPQVGSLLIQQDGAKDYVPQQPMDIVGAMTQGQIGYMIQQALSNELVSRGVHIPVVSIVNQVEVSGDDKAFDDPTKPVGPFFSNRDAQKITLKKGWPMKFFKSVKKDGYRRVVPSPAPIRNIEIEAISSLIESHCIVIASGGGGIPVYRKKDGTLHGVEAVIDKDLAGMLLAIDLGADVYMMLTDIECVKTGFGTDNEKGISKMNVQDAFDLKESGQFPEGTMGPKIDAAVGYVTVTHKKAIISSIDKIVEAFEGETGTLITEK